MNLLRLLSLSTALLSGLCFAVLAPIDAPTVPTLSRACGHIVNSQGMLNSDENKFTLTIPRWGIL
jgi:hypothetical protein